jgi:hypothetical protein
LKFSALSWGRLSYCGRSGIDSPLAVGNLSRHRPCLLLADPDMWHRARGEQVRVWLSSDGPETPPEKVPDPSRVWVYRHDTFAKIHFAVLKLGGRLGDLCRMLDPKVPQPRRLLCDSHHYHCVAVHCNGDTGGVRCNPQLPAGGSPHFAASTA